MANHNFLVANPTAADVTVNAQTVPQGKVIKLTLADTTTDLYGFVDAGCAVASLDATGTVDANVQLVEKGAHLLEGLARAVVSAGADAHAVAGV